MNSVNALRQVRKGAWTSDEDTLLRQCIHNYGEGRWHLVPQRAGLNRCRKSCRLRWLNYLRPTIRRGDFSADEVDLMMRLHRLLGNRWSLIAGRLPGRTANDVKNFWNTKIQKKLTIAGKEKELTHVIVKPLPLTLSKDTRMFCHSPSPGGERVCNNMINNTNDINMLIDKPQTPATPPPDHDGIEWWKNLFEEIGIHGQEKDDGLMLMASSSASQNVDVERRLISEHHEFPTPAIELASVSFQQDGQTSWSDFWDLLNSNFN